MQGIARNVRTIMSSRLSWTVASAVFGTILLIEFIIFIPAYISYRQELLQQVEARGLAYVRAVSEVHGEMPPDTYVQTVSRVARDTGWVGSASLSSHGEVLGQSGIPLDFITEGVPITATQRMEHANLASYEICWPSSKTGQPFAVAARFDTSNIGPQLQGYALNIALLSLMIAFGTTLMIMWLVGRRILIPLLSLRESMMQVAAAPTQAALVQVPASPGRDEIGDLLTASRKMISHVAATLDDMGKRNHELAVSERRFRRIFEESFDAIFVIDIRGNRIIDANVEACRMLGYRRDEFLRLGITDVHPDEIDALLDFAEEVKLKGRSRAFDLTCKARTGERIPADISATLIEWNDEPALLAVAHDMRPHKQLEAALSKAKTRAEEADRMKSRFLATMSHELRTPLNAIIGFSEMLLHEYFGPLGGARNREYVRDIRWSGEHLQELVSDILDITKIEAGEMPCLTEDVDLNQAFAEAVRMIEGRAAAKDVRLSIDEAPDATAHVDPRHLRQILLNLLNNAVKFTGEDGKIRLSAQDIANGVEIKVRDNGIGIAERDIDLVLQPFGQVKKSALVANSGGTGLGLPLSKQFAEINGGTLVIESTVGAGTVVTVTLPRSAAEWKAAATSRVTAYNAAPRRAQLQLGSFEPKRLSL